MSKYKIGIIGGSGFIGSMLARHLSKTFKVKILDKSPMPKDLESRVEFQWCDIREYNKVSEGLEDTNLVIHTAIIQIPLINEEKKLGYEVNVLGTQNICKVVDEIPSIKGMILAGSWHVFGERGLRGIINEGFGFRPDEVEDRARLYTLCKITQENIVRLYDEMVEKIYGTIRMGTVLGETMPKKTAANIFISRGIKGEPITPYKHSMHRPMLYIDINDVCKVFAVYARKILNGEIPKGRGSLPQIVNLCYPEPVSILELARMVRDSVVKWSKGTIKPEIKIIDKGQLSPFTPRDKEVLKVDVSRAKKLFNLESLTSPEESIERIVRRRISELLSS